MWNDGDKNVGWEVSIDSSKRVLRLRCWGLWNKALAASYDAAMTSAYDKLRGGPWYVLADISNFPPQHGEVAQVHAGLMARAVAAGMKRAVSVVHSSLTAMQIKRIADESRMPELAFHKTESDALRWLLAD